MANAISKLISHEDTAASAIIVTPLLVCMIVVRIAPMAVNHSSHR